MSSGIFILSSHFTIPFQSWMQYDTAKRDFDRCMSSSQKSTNSYDTMQSNAVIVWEQTSPIRKHFEQTLCVCTLNIRNFEAYAHNTKHKQNNRTSEFWKHCRHLPQHNLHNPHTVNKKLYCLSLLNIIGSKSFPFYLCLRWRLTVMCSNVDGLHTSQMTR